MSNETSENWLEAALASLGRARVTVFGDFCLDAYWQLEPDDSERSVETGLAVRRVRRQSYSLGGAGNIVANLAALGVRRIRPVGVVGDDLFGRQMLRLLADCGAAGEGMLVDADWQTLVYCKPRIRGQEQERIDFGGFSELSPALAYALEQRLREAAADSDVVILNQQVPGGVSTPELIERLNAVVADHPQTIFIVDSRHRAELYSGCLYKINAHEAARLLGRPRPLDEPVSVTSARELAQELCRRGGRCVFLTRGEHGLLVAEPGRLTEAPGIQALSAVDPVGAGDTALAAIAAVLGSGGDAPAAARLANIAAFVTVRKLGATGTASPDEIRAVGPQPDYVYLPELADDIRQARYLEGTEIEVVPQLWGWHGLPAVGAGHAGARTMQSPGGIRMATANDAEAMPPAHATAIRHAIFDHDGTISTLRQGWEQVMEPMMLRAILGPLHQDAEPELHHKALETVRRFIDRSTGIQTLAQMQHLVELVRQFQCVPEADILDMHGYKRLYNDRLLEQVRQRLAKLGRGELSSEDFLVRGARAMLEALRDRGVRLYLASGTDQQDVEAEAAALGYAELFEGRIFGAVGDVKVEAKELVLRRIFGQCRLSGPEVAVFGDGPVEVRQARKRGCIAVGVASDEVRRRGLNPVKRSRLIRAGADLVVPDFSQLDRLLAALGL